MWEGEYVGFSGHFQQDNMIGKGIALQLSSIESEAKKDKEPVLGEDFMKKALLLSKVYSPNKRKGKKFRQVR